jgi:hypothetical protein
MRIKSEIRDALVNLDAGANAAWRQTHLPRAFCLICRFRLRVRAATSTSNGTGAVFSVVHHAGNRLFGAAKR